MTYFVSSWTLKHAPSIRSVQYSPSEICMAPFYAASSTGHDKLSYPGGTARLAVAVETVWFPSNCTWKALQQANDLQGHSRSLEMAPIDRPYDTSYVSMIRFSRTTSCDGRTQAYCIYRASIALRGKKPSKSTTLCRFGTCPIVRPVGRKWNGGGVFL